MNTLKNLAIVLAVFAIFISSARGQDFLNLDFEAAYNLPGDPGSGELVNATDGTPAWNAYDAGAALPELYYVSNNLGNASSSVELEGGSLALNGNYSAALFTGGLITQTGMVPGNAESLQFEAKGPGPGYSLGAGSLSVTLGGMSLSYSPLSEGADYIVYGANIPAGMGAQNEALTFFVNYLEPGILLDNIEFSPTSVAEPGECGLIGVGVVLFGVSRRWLTAPSFVETSTEGRKSA